MCIFFLAFSFVEINFQESLCYGALPLIRPFISYNKESFSSASRVSFDRTYRGLQRTCQPFNVVKNICLLFTLKVVKKLGKTVHCGCFAQHSLRTSYIRILLMLLIILRLIILLVLYEQFYRKSVHILSTILLINPFKITQITSITVRCNIRFLNYNILSWKLLNASYIKSGAVEWRNSYRAHNDASNIILTCA